MRTLAVIQHVSYEDLGSFEVVFQARDFQIQKYEAGIDNLCDLVLHEADMLVLMGGPMAVYEEEKYSFIRQEINLIKSRIAKNLPILGICLGSQLIASALGAQVYPGRFKEIGWAKISSTGNNKYFNELEQGRGYVFHWHGDTFDLPDGAQLEASSTLYPNQAFTYNNNILALQFHPEVTEFGLEDWFTSNAKEIQANDIDLVQMRHDTKLYASELQINANNFLSKWLDGLNL